MEHILHLLDLIAEAMPSKMCVLVLADRGLWSQRLRRRIRKLGFHPVQRLQNTITFQPENLKRQPAQGLVKGPGQAWVGKGTAFKDQQKRCKGTLIVVWVEDEQEPWVLLSDLAPRKVGVWWYSLRVWIELGFRALKGVGWRWEHTRRTDPDRVARHWLVLAVATIWVMAYGTRAEDAELQGLPPGRLQSPPNANYAQPQPDSGCRQVSVFRRGLSWLSRHLPRGRLWRRLWLAPEPWPEPPQELQIVYHSAARVHAQYLPL